MNDIKENKSVNAFVDTEALKKWKIEDNMLETIEDQLLSILFIIKSKYPSTAEYPVIRSGITQSLDKISTLRRKAVAGEDNTPASLLNKE